MWGLCDIRRSYTNLSPEMYPLAINSQCCSTKMYIEQINHKYMYCPLAGTLNHNTFNKNMMNKIVVTHSDARTHAHTQVQTNLMFTISQTHWWYCSAISVLSLCSILCIVKSVQDFTHFGRIRCANQESACSSKSYTQNTHTRKTGFI